MDYLPATIVACVVALWFYLNHSKRVKPPGPWGLPLVGYVPFLTEKPYLKLQQLAKKYGNVFSLRLGSNYVVVINDFQTVKEAFTKDVFIARPPEFAFELTETSKKTGAVLGPPWKEQRRLALHLLRDLGFGKSKMEAFIQEETEELLDRFEEFQGRPFRPGDLLASSMSNNIASLTFGRRFKYDDPLRKRLNMLLNTITDAAGQTAWTLLFPRLKKLLVALGIGRVKQVHKLAWELKGLYYKEIEEHEKTLNPDNVRDFIDGYLLEMEKRKGDPTFHRDVLNDVVAAFFGAGSETVRTSVEWLILLVAHNQDHQRRLQAEVDEVVGRERLPIMPDQASMPFVSAYINEMERWMTLIPLNLQRYSLDDTQLGGYFIPKHTVILSNLWSIHHNPEYWGEDADQFKPERFLSEDGKSVRKIDYYIPFSIGKRSCPGEPLAKTEIFLYFTAILQRFNIRFPEGKQANFDSTLGIAIRPVPQDVIMTKRE